MAFRYRALKDDFIRHMNLRGWPAIKKVQGWFQREANGIKSEKFTQLKRGDALADKYATGFVRLLIDERAAHNPEHYDALREYLIPHGILQPTEVPLENILACVCDPATQRPAARAMVSDLLQRGFEAISEVIQTKRMLHWHVGLCETESDVLSAIQWFFVNTGRAVSPHGDDLSIADAIRAANDYTRTTLEEYQRRAVQWWKSNPWTISLPQGSRRSAAMAVLLPLSQRGYDAILAGDCMTYEILPKDIQVPSSRLLLEAVAERPLDLSAESLPVKNLTRAIYASMIAQAGVFTHRLSPSKTDAIRILSFGGTPVNEKRLKAFGFRSTRRYMPRTGLEYLEKSLPLFGPLSQDTLYLSLMRHFGDLLDPPDGE